VEALMKKYCPQCGQKYDDRKLRFCPEDGTPLSLPEPPLVGSTLDHRYRLDSLVGRGGFGLVYCAHHLGLNRRVAFKILKPDVAWECPPTVELFEKEAQMAAHLRHENIVEVFDAGRIGDISYIAMEWLDGRTLDEELEAGGRLSFERTAEILRQVAAALAVAHAKHTVHRDLKPSNVMLVKRPDGGQQVKVVDFGVAKVLSSTLGSDVSRAMGTPNYASPEQLKYGAQIDERADIYALGVMLYEMLTVQLPFSASSVEELIQLKLNSAPQPLRDVLPDAPAAVEGLLLRMIAVDPQQRPQKVSEVPALFEAAYQIAEPVAPAPGTAPAPQAPTMIDPVENSTGSRSDRLGKEPARPQPDEVRPLQPPPQDVAEEETRQRARVPEAPPERKPIEPVDQQPQPAKLEPAPPPAIHRPEPPAPPPPLRKRRLVIGASLIAVAIVGISWWLALSDNTSQTQTTPPTTSTSAPTSAPARVEVMNYSQEFKPDDKNRFRIHFKTRADGYLYVVAPDNNKRLLTLLTNRPAPEMGVASNRLRAGEDFAFPNGEWLTLEEESATLTLIFSARPLAQSDFLSAPQVRYLKPDELSLLEALRRQSARREPQVDESRGAVTARPLAETPLVIEIKAHRQAAGNSQQGAAKQHRER
jgi:serine/threonine protein kinase